MVYATSASDCAAAVPARWIIARDFDAHVFANLRKLSVPVGGWLLPSRDLDVLNRHVLFRRDIGKSSVFGFCQYKLVAGAVESESSRNCQRSCAL